MYLPALLFSFISSIFGKKQSSMSENDERFDGLYLNVAQTAQGIEPLLDTVFGFLRRKTDFFQGPSNEGPEAAIAKVNEVLQKHVKIYEKQQQSKKEKKSPSKPLPTPPPTKQGEMAITSTDDSVIEMDAAGGFDADTPTVTNNQTASAAPLLEKDTINEAGKDEDKKRGPRPIGNGGTVDGKYVWTQTLSEVNVNVNVPPNTRGRDLNVTISKNHLKVGLKVDKGTWIIDAPLTKPIIVDDSFWTVEDGNRLSINMQKLKQTEWWEGVCVGDPTINIQDIEPESSSISDLDGETQKTVTKMMFDQRQKAMGLPTSDEQQKMEMLEKFKRQHPELDFSNAKIQ